MNSQTQRRLAPAEAEVVTLPGNWRKPLPAILADALANSQALLARLDVGMFAPDFQNEAYYRATFRELRQATSNQIKAFEKFMQIGWSEQ
jgi:hypothetical protein